MRPKSGSERCENLLDIEQSTNLDSSIIIFSSEDGDSFNEYSDRAAVEHKETHTNKFLHYMKDRVFKR